jgi:hypothetical protein
MIKKYELLKSDTIIQQGKTLHHIRYLIDIPRHNIKVGDLGGFLESENNLSHDGDAAVFDSAWVYGNAMISGYARVSGYAWVYGNAKVFGNAKVSGNVVVYGNAKVNSGKHKDINITEDLIIRSLPLWKVLYDGTGGCSEKK